MRRLLRRLALPTLCLATVLAGVLSTVSLKAAYQTKVDGAPFSKPFFMELLVGLAMTTSLLVLPCRKRAPATERRSVRHFLPLLPLATCDLLVGLGDTTSILLAPASIISIVDCSILVFSALATRLVLGTRYSWLQWSGIFAAAVGVIIVGSGAIGSERSAVDAMAPLGVLLALCARVLQSVQFAFEERFMKTGRFSPLLQVGAEGAIESAMCAVIVLPLVYFLPGSDHGKLEDVADTLRMLQRSPALCVLCALSFASLALLNPLSMAIGQQHGSVLRVFIDIGRPVIVWAVSLVAHRLSGGDYGEGWSEPKSWVELVGFAALICGLTLYCCGSRGRASFDGTDSLRVGATAEPMDEILLSGAGCTAPSPQ
mmetsp:Transcript_52025/g.139961  ORF Transcript_52025/g.139961 Transcript_52025/m.139961 type:complete len:371 (-) Transcript_52025:303-1415(-)